MAKATKMWVRFESFQEPWQSKSRTHVKKRTCRWNVLTLDGSAVLGDVQWFTPWRQYTFSPVSGTVHNPACLRQIAHFCEARTIEHRASNKSAKEAIRQAMPIMSALVDMAGGN